jgi:outer membrane murein-binding lipoprotein Lpp
MNRRTRLLTLALFVSGGLLFSSCSSSPSDEELAALKALQAQADGLNTQVNDAQRDKANLEKQIADKNAKLQQCQSDQDAVKKALGGK